MNPSVYSITGSYASDFYPTNCSLCCRKQDIFFIITNLSEKTKVVKYPRSLQLF